MQPIRDELDRGYPHWSGMPEAPGPHHVASHVVERAGQRWIVVGALLLAFVLGCAAGILVTAHYPTEPVASAPAPTGAPVPSVLLPVGPPAAPPAAPARPERDPLVTPRRAPLNPSATDRGAAARSGGAAAMAPTLPPPPSFEPDADRVRDRAPAPAWPNASATATTEAP
jgi:hypothetical protein